MRCQLVAAFLLAAPPPTDIVEAFNLSPSGGALVEEDGSWRLKGGCGGSATVDKPNAFISISTHEGPKCEEDATIQFTAFRKSDGSYVWLRFSDGGIYYVDLAAYRFDGSALVPDKAVLASLPQLTDVLPAELATGKPTETRVYYLLPHQGTTVVAVVRKKALLALCNAELPSCAPGAQEKLKAVRRAKWNRATGLFELQPR